MKRIKLIIITITFLSIAGCKSKKKVTSTVSSTTATSSTTTPNSVTPTTGFSVFSNPAASSDGVYVPGEKELVAIQAQYTDVTLEKLKEGHMLYTIGACVNCHGAKNIYKREESRWKDIIDNMAEMAKITAGQKDAVYKYVLAIKATQPK